MGPIIAIAVILTALRLILPLLTSNPEGAQGKAIAGTPVTPIGSLAEGMKVRVVGEAAMLPGSDEHVTAPHSGKPALAVVYERYALHGRYRDRKELLDRQVRFTRFALEDKSGTVVLDLEHARFSLDMAEAELAETGPNRVFGAGVIAGNQWGDQMKHEEGGVVPGNRLTVQGRVVRDANGALVLTGTEIDPVVVVALRGA